MKRIFILIMATGFCLTSCVFIKVNPDWVEDQKVFVSGTGDEITQTYQVSAFNGIEINAPMDVEFVQSDCEPYVEIKAQENIQKYVVFEVKNGTLRFKTDNVMIRTYSDISAKVYGPTLSSVSIIGSADFNTGRLVSEKLMIAIAGSGDVDVRAYEGRTVSAAIAGSGEITISGKADSADFSIAGSGEINIKDLELTGKANCEISGSGSINR